MFDALTRLGASGAESAYEIDNSLRNENFKNISFFKIFRKYLSKRIRTIFK